MIAVLRHPETLPATSNQPPGWRPAEGLAGTSTQRDRGAPRTLPAMDRDDRTAQQTLVARMVAGDSGALTIVYESWGGLVFGLARRVAGDEETAREVTQEVFVHLWQNPDRVDLTRGTLKAYLGVMAHRRAVDAVRRRATRERVQQLCEACEDGVEAGHDDAIVDADHASWQATRVRAALDRLPPEQRTALELAYFRGRTYREVALELDIPEGTAKSRLRLGLAQLRRLLSTETPHEASI